MESKHKKNHKFRTICPCPLSKCSTANVVTRRIAIPDYQLQILMAQLFSFSINREKCIPASGHSRTGNETVEML